MSLESWKAFFEIGGVILLFLTFVFGAGALLTSTRINAHQAERLRQFDTDLTGAKTELSKQQVRAAQAEQNAADAKRTAAEAEQKAEGFRLEIARADEKAAEADARAAEANLELAKMRTPRTLSQKDQAELAAELGHFAGTAYDLSVATDSESVEFMKVLQSVLSKSGWKHLPVKGAVGLSGSDPLIGITLNSGVYVEIDAGKFSQWGPAVDKLVGLLKEKGIAAQGNAAATGADPTAIHVYVGKKP